MIWTLSFQITDVIWDTGHIAFRETAQINFD